MSIFAYHTTQIDHVYEPLYLVVYDHSEKLREVEVLFKNLAVVYHQV